MVQDSPSIWWSISVSNHTSRLLAGQPNLARKRRAPGFLVPSKFGCLVCCWCTLHRGSKQDPQGKMASWWMPRWDSCCSSLLHTCTGWCLDSPSPSITVSAFICMARPAASVSFSCTADHWIAVCVGSGRRNGGWRRTERLRGRAGSGRRWSVTGWLQGLQPWTATLIFSEKDCHFVWWWTNYLPGPEIADE